MTKTKKVTVKERMEMLEVEGWIAKTFATLLNFDGVLTTKEHGKDRIEICKGCNMYGKVKPAEIMQELDGCTICKCPSLTKPFMLEHPLMEGRIVKCPHPNGSKWAEVDRKHAKIAIDNEKE